MSSSRASAARFMYLARVFAGSSAQAGWIRATSSTTPCTSSGTIVGTVPISSPVAVLNDSRVEVDWAWVGTAVALSILRFYGGRSTFRHGRSRRRRAIAASGRRAARGSHAPALAGGGDRAGARARAGLGAAHRDRERQTAQRDPLRPARRGEDDAGADRRRGRRRGLRGGVGGQRRQSRDPRGDRAGAGAAPGEGAADDPLPRRDPPLQQGPAGRAAAGGRGRDADP